MKTIRKIIDEKLDGDEKRVTELFSTDSIFDELKGDGWYYFQEGSYDGEYFVRSTHGYACYKQERGSKSDVRTFQSLSAAAQYFFKEAGFFKENIVDSTESKQSLVGSILQIFKRK